MDLLRFKEWESIPIDDRGGTRSLTRKQADGLLHVAKRAARHLSLGESADKILVNGHHQLTTCQVVGILASPGATLEILPKIDTANDALTRESVVRMLARTFDLPIADGELTGVGFQKHDLLEILIRLFCRRLFDAIRSGLPRQYIAHEDDLTVIRGRLNYIRQYTTLATMPQKLACRFDELSPDIPLNQIMKAAIGRLKQTSRSSDNQRSLFELGSTFSEVTNIDVKALRWDLVVLDRTNRHWETLLIFAKLLLGDRFQSTSYGGDFGYSLLFEMNTLFEEFIGRSLRASIRKRITLQYRRGHALSDDVGRNYFATKPDIVIHGGSDQLDWVVDTKWKRLTNPSENRRMGISPEDVYQLMAYAQVHSCPRVMLLYPHHSGMGPAPGRIAEFQITGSQSRLVVATVDLTDVRTVPKQLSGLFGVAN